MYGDNFRAPKVDIHQFSMIPRAEIPRSTFRMQSQHKTTFNATLLIPIFITEALPGDTWAVNMTAFIRMSTPIFPIMDNMDLETWFFYVPNRIIWSHWVNFCGEQPNSPGDSISYVIPQIVSPASGFAAGSLYDYLGLPGVGQISAGSTTSINALPLRAYNLIWNQWFRDENLQNALGFGATNTYSDFNDGPDPYTNYTVMSVNKRHDYFTSCLPWTQKGGQPITLPLGTSAIVKTAAGAGFTGAQTPVAWNIAAGGAPTANQSISFNGSSQMSTTATVATANATGVYPNNLYADLSTATAATINQIRLAFQTQKLLERDARGGTRYQELLMSHFGVHPLDSRLQRPEYLGGGRSPVNIAPVPQTTATGITGGTSPLGTLSAVGTATARQHGFRQSFTEHGYILGLAAIRADNTYQQGTRRMWTRSTRYDFYWPVFAMLGEQSVRNDEIYTLGSGNFDTNTFGYQERWAEYRYFPSHVSGSFRSTYPTPLDAWHLAQKYTALPALTSQFITDNTINVLTRVLAGGASIATNNEQFLCDLFFDMKVARPMPMYSVPGLIDHF